VPLLFFEYFYETQADTAFAILFIFGYANHHVMVFGIRVAVATPRLSKFARDYHQGNNRLLPSTEDGVEEMFSIAVYYTDRIPRNRQVSVRRL